MSEQAQNAGSTTASAKVSQELAKMIETEAGKAGFQSQSEVVRRALWSYFGEGEAFQEQPIDERVLELHDEVSELSDTVDDLSLAVQDAGMLDERLRVIESRLAKLEEGGDA
jgi:Arc/MetJ-type ribon-helix-helix transcriptional regulator